MHRFFRDKQGKVAVLQRPNLALSIWIVIAVAKRIFTTGSLYQTLDIVGLVALVVWAVMEIISGDSYFRRGLGLLVLVLTVAARIA